MNAVARTLGLLVSLAGMTALAHAAGAGAPPREVALSSGWKLQDIAKVSQPGAEISAPAFKAAGWYKATVPGTVLTSLVNDGVYPEPLFGENNRPDKIPESLCRTSYWYRTEVTVPREYAGRRVWLNFHGINYTAQIWCNGQQVGEIRGAFARGNFDVTSVVKPGERAILAVLIQPPPHPQDNPPEQTVALGLGPNGGIMSHDGPTFICTQGWDWIPAIRDRDMGIWQKVTLSATGGVILKDPYVVTDLPLPRTDSADVKIAATLQNVTGAPISGTLRGTFGTIAFERPVTVAANATLTVDLNPQNTPQLHLTQPRLWWPNGLGEPNLYPLRLTFETGGKVSDAQELQVGVRKVTYEIPGSEWLTICVNGVPVFCKGGDWGMDEAMKRIPRERLEAQIRFHREANYTIIRNWVGQSTGEDFYDLCDRYGIMIWDEFFQPNPADSGRTKGSKGDDDISDIPLYLANVREKVLRFRNHPSIALWCGRNEGVPTPATINEGNAAILSELDPARLYQPSSTDGRGVRSNGPYAWRPPAAFYTFQSKGPRAEVFKTEIGSSSIPSLESVQGMLDPKDWDAIGNDAWAEHDLARGANRGDKYPAIQAARYGATKNLAGFVRAAQLMNYEAFRAMYEGRQARMFADSTAVITWMSNPAQPSFTWQIYSYDLEPFSSFFGAKKACEPVHVQMNEDSFHVMVINNAAAPLERLQVRVRVFNLDGSSRYDRTLPASAPASSATDLGAIEFPADLSPVHFVKLELHDAQGRLVSDNFYWRGVKADDLTALNELPLVSLQATAVSRRSDGKRLLDVTLTNPTRSVALMSHLQLRRQSDGKRVLPVYYTDNYVSLLPGESRTLTIEAAEKDLAGSAPQIVIDGWNVTTDAKPAARGASGVSVAPNPPAMAWQ